ncbi:hypothetical protein G6F23_015369 [Rhizopus arrhizus]|nr:hypothetical protein G6F23_015369 [Rhizopus arrhizus]
MQRRVGIGVDGDGRSLSRPHMHQLPFAEIRHYIGLLQRHDGKDCRARADIGPYAQRAAADRAVDGRGDLRVRQVQVGAVLQSLGA